MTDVTKAEQAAARTFIKLAEQRGQTVAQWVRDVAEAEVTIYESTEDMMARQQVLLDEVTQHVAEEEVRLLKSQAIARRDPNLIELSPGVFTLRRGAIEEHAREKATDALADEIAEARRRSAIQTAEARRTVEHTRQTLARVTPKLEAAGLLPVQRSALQDDHQRDLQDPEYRRAYKEQYKKLTRPSLKARLWRWLVS